MKKPKKGSPYLLRACMKKDARRLRRSLCMMKTRLKPAYITKLPQAA